MAASEPVAPAASCTVAAAAAAARDRAAPPPHTAPSRTLINIKSIIYDEMKVREEESLGASLLRLVTELEEEEARIQVTLLAASGVIH